MFYIATTAIILVLIGLYYVLDWFLYSLKVGNITDKYVFITGCDSGFGHLAAKQLDKLGFHVFAGCFTKEGAQSVTEKCSSRVTTVDLDVRSTQSIQKAYQSVKDKLPPDTGLWGLVNNAGICYNIVPTEMWRREDVQATLEVNLLGPIDMVHHFLPLVRKSKGRIVNTTSISARLAMAPIDYTVSKFGLDGFSSKLRQEVSSQGIHVSIVEPGAFRTSIINKERIFHEYQVAFDRSSPDVQDVYGGTEGMRKACEVFIRHNERGSTNLGLVVAAYTHALTARFPRIRYPAGNDAKWIYLPLSFLPDRMSDFILKRIWHFQD